MDQAGANGAVSKWTRHPDLENVWVKHYDIFERKGPLLDAYGDEVKDAQGQPVMVVVELLENMTMYKGEKNRVRAGIFRTAAEAKAAIDAKLGASAAKMRDEKLESCHRASAAAAAAAARAADQAAAAAAAAAQAAAAAAQAVEAGGGVKHRFGSIARYPTSTPARSGLQSYGATSRPGGERHVRNRPPAHRKPEPKRRRLSPAGNMVNVEVNVHIQVPAACAVDVITTASVAAGGNHHDYAADDMGDLPFCDH